MWVSPESFTFENQWSDDVSICCVGLSLKHSVSPTATATVRTSDQSVPTGCYLWKMLSQTHAPSTPFPEDVVHSALLVCIQTRILRMRKSNQPTDRGRKRTLPLIFNWEKSRPWPCDAPHFVSLLSLLRFTTTTRSCSFTFPGSYSTWLRSDWVGSGVFHLLLLLLGGRREKQNKTLE